MPFTYANSGFARNNFIAAAGFKEKYLSTSKKYRIYD